MRKIHTVAATFATGKLFGSVYLYRQQEVKQATDRQLSNLAEESRNENTGTDIFDRRCFFR